jgi:bifunctional DNA-binding transcriptional regulator/antitoxin component of YhaV-PrlF toxin-antitoxin module
MKETYVTQPFQVGSKYAKSRSMAIIIPHEVVKQYGIGTSTVIIFRTNNSKKTIILQTVQDKISPINQNLISVVDADSSKLPHSNR